jgi:hypothetical protein
MSKRIKIKDFLQDDKNFNKHTESGMELLKKSIEKVGVIESITVSNDDKVISGNARQEKIAEVLGEDIEPIYIETDGKRPVVLKRTDIESGTKEFHEAALFANTTAKKNINLDNALIEEVAVEEFDIDVEELGVEVVFSEPQTSSGFNSGLPPELQGRDLEPNSLEKIIGEDETLMQRVIITYPFERKEELERILGIKIEKVVYNLNELSHE